MNIYCSNCIIGSETGDGNVCGHELNALQSLGDEVKVLDASLLRKHNPNNDVWLQDYFALNQIQNIVHETIPELFHAYGGPYGIALEDLKSIGTKTVVTLPAHHRARSIEEHEIWFGKGSYPFAHVRDDELWELYTEHVRLADTVIAPSSHSKQNIMRDMRVQEKQIVIIPHGCIIPETVRPLPEKFTVGYLSQTGIDKGLAYLIKAWSELNYKDTELIIAGARTDTLEPFVRQLAPNGKFRLLGRVEKPGDVYNACSVMVAPSTSEGFGITVVEALAHGRPVITTDGCGASDAITNGINGFIVPIRNPHEIAQKIDLIQREKYMLGEMSRQARKSSLRYEWRLVEKEYVAVYEHLLEKNI